MADPFVFNTESSLVQSAHYHADSLPSFLYCLQRVSGSSIFHHFYHSLLRRHFLKSEFQNDFAFWVDQNLREPALAEKLTTVDPMDLGSIREARERLIEHVRPFVASTQSHVRVVSGMEFRFLEAMSFVYPSGLVATDLETFARAIRNISVSSLFFHLVTARLRGDEGQNDFSIWLDKSLGESALAREIEQLNPYRYNLVELRQKISDLVQARLVS